MSFQQTHVAGNEMRVRWVYTRQVLRLGDWTGPKKTVSQWNNRKVGFRKLEGSRFYVQRLWRAERR